jgi:hypothetical protein
MKTIKRFGFGLGVVVIALASHGLANDKNFKNANGYRGCDSIITRDGITECKAVQTAKNVACNRASTCEFDKQESWAREYDALYRWWDNEGKKLPDNQYKSDQQRKMRDLVTNLTNGRAAANAGITIAKECIAARDAVQKWFESRAIPLANDVRNELVPKRRTLVDKFNETKNKREEAKKKYEDGGSKDDNLKREWEAARDANIKAGQELDDFDKQYGPDIQYYFDNLISHYQSEKTNHDTPSREAENRLTRCDRTVNVEWKSLPF